MMQDAKKQQDETQRPKVSAWCMCTLIIKTNAQTKHMITINYKLKIKGNDLIICWGKES